MTDNEATGGARSFRFGVVAPLRTDVPAWRDQVRRIADSGFSTLLMPDVQQWQPAPGPTLAVAATLADLRVGTWVYASPLRPAWNTAWEAHSLSVLTEGRFEMGIGTGRPGIEDELRDRGMPVVPPRERLAQVRETVAVPRGLDGAARGWAARRVFQPPLTSGALTPSRVWSGQGLVCRAAGSCAPAYRARG